MFKRCETFNPCMLEPLLKYHKHICNTLHREKNVCVLWPMGTRVAGLGKLSILHFEF